MTFERTPRVPTRVLREAARALAGCVCAAAIASAFAQTPPQMGTAPASSVAASGMQLDLSSSPVFRPGAGGNDAVFFGFSIQAQNERLVALLAQDDIFVARAGAVLSSKLERTSGDNASVIVALDMSGSMVMDSGRWGTTKLEAAKDAMKAFLTSLLPGDRVEILTFDQDVRQLYPLGSDIERALALLDAEQIANTGSQNRTALYDAIDSSINRAKELRVLNVVIITDGMHDTEERRAPPAGPDCRNGEHVQFIKSREDAIIGQAGNVRVFTIGVGDSDVQPCALGWADLETLDNVSRGTGAGPTNGITLKDLALATAVGTPRGDALKSALAGTLARIRDALRHDYTLTIPIKASEFLEGVPQTFRVEVTTLAFDRTTKVRLPLEFTFLRRGRNIDVPEPPRVLVAISIIPPAPSPFGRDLTGDGGEGPALIYGLHYGGILLLLGSLAMIPPLQRRRAQAKADRIADAAVLVLGRTSPHLGKTCPNEGRLGADAEPFRQGDYAVVCPNCHTPHHIACWALGNKHRCWRCYCVVCLSAESLKHKDD